jgi:hypothetical protein
MIAVDVSTSAVVDEAGSCMIAVDVSTSAVVDEAGSCMIAVDVSTSAEVDEAGSCMIAVDTTGAVVNAMDCVFACTAVVVNVVVSPHPAEPLTHCGGQYETACTPRTCNSSSAGCGSPKR